MMLHVIADAANPCREMHYHLRSLANFIAALRVGQIDVEKFQVVAQVSEVISRTITACEIGDSHLRAFCEEPFNQMRADKSAPACHHHLLLLPEKHSLRRLRLISADSDAANETVVIRATFNTHEQSYTSTIMLPD